jgi:predicted amidohydrolase YtcJ
MTRDEAVRSFTIWNARSIGREAELGSLEPGKRADLIALSEDVFTCAPERIAGIAPVLTMVGGAVAHADQEVGASLSTSFTRSGRSVSDTSA